MAEYTILLCPVCGEQVADDPEYGASCYHDREIEAIRIKADPIGLEPALALARFRLAQEQGEHDWKAAESRVWWNLPEDERKRITEERRAKMDPLTRALHDSIMSTQPLHLLSRVSNSAAGGAAK